MLTTVTTRRLAVVYAVVMGLATALYFSPYLWTPTRLAGSCLVALAAAAAIGTGIRRYRSRSVGSWVMIAAALVLTAASRVVYELLPGELGTLKPWVWTVWVLDGAMLVLLVAGVLGLARSRAQPMFATLDATVIVLGAGLLAGVLLAIPYASKPGIGPLWEAARVGYVLRDVIILAMAIHLVTAVRASASVLLVCTGLLGFLTYDVLFRIGRIRGEYLLGTPIDLGWLLFFVAVGAAALVPSMAELGASQRPAGTRESSVRLGLVVIAALLPFGILVVWSFQPHRWYEPLIVAVAAAILALVLVRAVGLAYRLGRQVDAETTLRGAITDLAAASDVANVTSALDRTVRRLLPAEANYRLVLTSAQLAGIEGARDATLRETANLPPPIRAQLGEPGPTLAIPVIRGAQAIIDAAGSEIDEQSAGLDRNASMILLIRADRAALNGVHGRLEALARQAASVLQRIALQEQVVRQSNEAYFRDLVQNSADVILILDDEKRIRYASPSAQAIFGVAPLDGVPLPALVDRAERAGAERLLDLAAATTPYHVGETRVDNAESMHADWMVRRSGREPARVQVSFRNLRDIRSVGGLVVTLRDITQEDRLTRELTHRTFYDHLTGLANRLQFTEHVEAAIHIDSKADKTASVLLLDLDDLNMINDVYGHDVGDIVLTRLAERLRVFTVDNAGSAHDLAARFGGDEFAVLLTGLSGPEAAEGVADRLTSAVGQPMRIAGREVTCSASLGVATTAEPLDSSEDLLRFANLALYAAKGAGKGRWRHYEPWMRGAVMERLELRSSLEHAIDDRALFLEYQPVVALDSGEVVGFEALLRWNHPTRGRLGPDQFIGVAEESGLIGPISEWAIATATAAMHAWDSSPHGPYVAVNISASQFALPNFTSSIRSALADSELPPGRLVLEITESLLLQQESTVVRDLQALRENGVRVAIDDFGTGYSALSYLRHVPLDVVKLDRSFIQNATDSAQQSRLQGDCVVRD